MYLTLKETNKFKVISAVLEGQLKIGEAVKLLNLSQRQICRLKHRVKKEGAKGLIHKSRGKRRPRWLTQEIKNKIDRLYKTKYDGANLSSLTEILNSREKIKVSRESVRQILLSFGSYRRRKKHIKFRQWREFHLRKDQMYQFGTSGRGWLKDRIPHQSCLTSDK